MGLFLHLALLLLVKVNGFPKKSKNAEVLVEQIYSMESHIMLNCTYNCSSGWVRANWQLESSNIRLDWNLIQYGDLCDVSIRLNITRTSAKMYRCISEETDKTQITPKILRQVFLQFGAHPSHPVLSPVVISPREASSEPLEMTCAAEGFYPKQVKVTWFLNGILLKEAKDVITGPAADETFSVLSRITLPPSTSILRDNVTCEIHHNSLTQPLRTKASLDRQYLPVRMYYSRDPGGSDEVMDFSNTIRTHVGAFLRLRCFAEGKLPPTVQWYKSDITATLWFNISNDTTVTLAELNEEDAGVYKCQTPIYTYILSVVIERPGAALWLKVLAAVMVSVVAVLALSAMYFCLTCNKRTRGEFELKRTAFYTRREKMSESVYSSIEHEVPYADIIISVRGSSTPELSNVMHALNGNYGKRRQEESGLSPLLQVSHSADRLHVQQREVTRKMSTTSEYAIISYYPEIMG
ncbi:signal-regulatory protein beta-1-like isoform X2 [Arapaima gigas]